MRVCVIFNNQQYSHLIQSHFCWELSTHLLYAFQISHCLQSEKKWKKIVIQTLTIVMLQLFLSDSLHFSLSHSLLSCWIFGFVKVNRAEQFSVDYIDSIFADYVLFLVPALFFFFLLFFHWLFFQIVIPFLWFNWIYTHFVE